MIHFTDKAVAHINKALARFPNGGFRLSVKKSGCSGYEYTREVVDGPKTGDIEWVTEQGLRVFIDSAWVKVMENVEVDLETKQLGQEELIFHNPNVIGECGCGKSFHIPNKTDG